jgi:hypothetical protein
MNKQTWTISSVKTAVKFLAQGLFHREGCAASFADFTCRIEQAFHALLWRDEIHIEFSRNCLRSAFNLKNCQA